MMKIHVARLLRARAEAEGRVIPLKEVSSATGISVSVLSNLASPRGGATTNSRYLEALARYFQVPLSQLLELQPPLGEETSCHVDALYPTAGEPPQPPRATAAAEAPLPARRRGRPRLDRDLP